LEREVKSEVQALEIFIRIWLDARARRAERSKQFDEGTGVLLQGEIYIST
jgi:hypothetical protein